MATRWQENYQVYRRYVRNLALMYQKRQDVKIFTELLLTLSVVVIFGLFAIRPTLVTIIGLNSDIRAKEKTNEQLDQKVVALNAARVVYDANLNEIRLIEDAIPENPYPVLFARQVEGLAKRHGVTITTMNTQDVALLSPQQTEEESPAGIEAESVADAFPSTSQSFPFELSVSGNFEQAKNFLTDFELLRTPLFADNLSVQTSSIENSEEIVVNISGRLSYLPNE